MFPNVSITVVSITNVMIEGSAEGEKSRVRPNSQREDTDETGKV